MILLGIEQRHIPVMVPEVLEGLNVHPGGRYIDATAGEGGHSRDILIASDPGGQILGIDADPEAVSVAIDRLSGYGDAFKVVNTNFRDLRVTALRYDFVPVHGILFDLGVSSLQLDKETRGFSFKRPDPLDMRFSIHQKVTAADIVNEYPEMDLADLIFTMGEDKSARRIAYAIVMNRPFYLSSELAETIRKSVRPSRSKIHPATRAFQALRIAVNDELSSLELALKQAGSLLGQGGRLVVISYHSLEDRIVKNFFRRESSNCVCPPGGPICICDHKPTLKLITRKPVTPGDIEVNTNPRSRSAKLRIVERI